MKSFLVKYKLTIVYWIVFLAIILYFVPGQHDYYLDDDVKGFKKTYLTPFLVWTGVLSIVLLSVIVLVKSKSVIQSGIASLTAGIMLAFFLFIFQDSFLGAALFINRQFSRETVQRSYVASFRAGIEHTKNNLVPYDLSTKHISIDRKLINKIFNAGIKQNDTITLTFGKGLFGIPFQSNPLDDK